MSKIVVHCPTEAKFKAVQEKAFREGYIWRSDVDVQFHSRFWETYKDQTCILLKEDKTLQYADKDFYEEEMPFATFLSASEYLKEEPMFKSGWITNNIKPEKEDTMEVRSDVAKVYKRTEDALLVSKEMRHELVARQDDYFSYLFVYDHNQTILEEAKRRKAEREKKEVVGMK